MKNGSKSNGRIGDQKEERETNIPRGLYLRFCQAVMEAAQAMGDAVSQAQPESVALSAELAEAMRTFFAYHPDEEVADFYLDEIDRALGKGKGDGC